MIKVTMYLDEEAWKTWRIACLQRKTSASKATERLIRQQLAAWEVEEKNESPQGDTHG